MAESTKKMTLSLESLLVEKNDPKKLIAQSSFEQAMELLESLVLKVEEGELALDKAVRSYEVGTLLVEHLRGHISGAEEKLKVLAV